MRGRRPRGREARGTSPPRARRRPYRCKLVLRPAHVLLLAAAATLGLLLGWVGHDASSTVVWGERKPPPPPTPPPPVALPSAALAAAATPCGEELGAANGTPCLPRRMLFVGGLQRSGTSTLASLLLALPRVAGLAFDPSRVEHMEAAPWKRVLDVHTGSWMKWAYFKEVVATGGAEGKLLQSIFPYRYSLWDAKFTPLQALLAHPTALSPLLHPAARGAVWSEWSRFSSGATSSSDVFVDKSPENVLMAPFLQSLFGASRTSFVFVVRHPLCWALVASKWACVWEAVRSEPPLKAPPLGCVEHLVEVSLAVHEKLAAHMPLLRDAHVVQAESDEWLTSPAWLQRVAGGSLSAARDAAASSTWRETQVSFRRTSHEYVYCFLNGYPPPRARLSGRRPLLHPTPPTRHTHTSYPPARLRRSGDACGKAKESSRGSRAAWLGGIAARHGARAARLGYTLHLLPLADACCSAGWSEWSAGEEATRSVHDVAVVAQGGRGRYEAHADGGEGIGLHCGKVALMVATNFLSGFNGMQQRAAQLTVALGKLGYAMHYVSIGPLNSTADCAVSDPAVLCHAAGDSMDQYRGFARFAREQRRAPSLLVLGFTSLTLELVRSLRSRPASEFSHWKQSAYDPAHIPKAHHALEVLQAAVKDFPFVRLAIFTDDIHFQRARYILASAAALKPAHERVLAAAKALELRTYARAGVIFTVSEPDRDAISAALRQSSDAPPPMVRVVPFSAAPAASVPPRHAREAGAMLYVGTCHPVAKAGIVWLLQSVFPRLEALASAAGVGGKLTLRLVGNGWQALRGTPPFERWVGNGWLQLLGKLDDAALDALYRRSLLFVSPLLNATGIATKNFHAMARGLPLLTTRMGAVGMLLPNRSAAPCCSGGTPRGCRLPSRAAARPMGAAARVRRPSLQEDCALAPKRMECQAWLAARRAAASAPARRPLLGVASAAGASVRGEGAAELHEDALPSELLAAARVAGDRVGVATLRADLLRWGGGERVPTRDAAAPRRLHPSAHPSGALLVTDDPSAFAGAALDVLLDGRLWNAVSSSGRRHQRTLSVARQSAVIAEGLQDGLQQELPAEQACILILEAADRSLLREPLAALLRLRVAVHLLLLPEAASRAEVDLLGWDRMQGVHVYSGLPREQWTAILASASVPAIRFALVLHSSLRDFGRQLQHPHCHRQVPGPLCIWEEGKAEQVEGHQGEAVRLYSEMGRVLMSEGFRELVEPAASASVAGRAGGEIDGGGAAQGDQEGNADDREGAEASREGKAAGAADEETAEAPMSLLQLLVCMRSAGGDLPLVLLSAGLQPLRLSRLLRAHVQLVGAQGSAGRSSSKLFSRSARRAEARAAVLRAVCAELLRLALQHERALFASFKLVLGANAHEAALLALLDSPPPPQDDAEEGAAERGGPPSSVLLPPQQVRVFPRFELRRPPAAPRDAPPRGVPCFLVVADAAAEVQEGLLWLLRDVWPRVVAQATRAEGTEEPASGPAAVLKLHGAGWRRFLNLGRGASVGHVASWLGDTSQELFEQLVSLRRSGGLLLEHLEPEAAVGIDSAPYADSPSAATLLDNAYALLLPRLHNETGVASPSWGHPQPEAAALARGVPIVAAAGDVPHPFRAREVQLSGVDDCAIAPYDSTESFAGAAARLLERDTWLHQSRLAHACATSHFTVSQADLGWTKVLEELLAEDYTNA
ncbi:hypothetical protein AB1Y20_023101 [Prymnesium parvum]|uniref:Protein-tyrosine sulfotransferase n=1 Tax=Prymnesium parvum TaxID=97485 RepID=A0AB34JEF7_PRYPA